MSDTKEEGDKKLKELREIMTKFADENPLALPNKQKPLPDEKLSTEFTVVETSRTLTYSQKGWKHYGELVGHPRGNQ